MLHFLCNCFDFPASRGKCSISWKAFCIAMHVQRQTILSEMADKILEALRPNRMHKKKITFAYFVPIKVVANITSRALLILVMLMSF